jgi:hypothetical protein
MSIAEQLCVLIAIFIVLANWYSESWDSFEDYDEPPRS